MWSLFCPIFYGLQPGVACSFFVNTLTIEWFHRCSPTATICRMPFMWWILNKALHKKKDVYMYTVRVQSVCSHIFEQFPTRLKDSYLHCRCQCLYVMIKINNRFIYSYYQRILMKWYFGISQDSKVCLSLSHKWNTKLFKPQRNRWINWKWWLWWFCSSGWINVTKWK